MSCSVCGSNANCGCSSSCITDPALPCGCGPSVTPGGCCQNVVQATPTPFYACAPACPESHVQKITIQSFSADVKIADSWNIPACGESAVVNGVSLRAIVVGSYIWNPDFGYFEVTAFNSGTGQMTLTNHCNDGNASPGTTVSACTEFTVVDPPCDCVNTSQVCVAIDFTAPANGDCLDITLTTIGTIQAGDIIQIGTGRYYVDHIVSSTIINICNQGEGITPGTPVIALNSAGDYQYCIVIIETCCTQIEAEFPGGLTPCADFKYRAVNALDTPAAINSVTIAEGTSSASNIAAGDLVNNSTCRAMRSIIAVSTQLETAPGNSGTVGFNVFYRIQESINGGAFTTVFEVFDSHSNTTITADPLTKARQFCFFSARSVLAGVTTNVRYKAVIEVVHTSGAGTGNVLVATWTITAAMLGVAAA